MPTPLFDHEKLEVYQLGIQFVAWLEPILHELPRPTSAREQLERASTSIPLNIAEGNGRFTERDRCRFFDTARGSALECAACLDVLVSKDLLTSDRAREGKDMLVRVVSMLVGLIKSTAASRTHEDRPEWGEEKDYD